MTDIPRLPATVDFSLAPRWDTGSGIGADVSMGWSPEALRTSFRIREPQIRSLETDPWLVHRDSCVEIFFMEAAAEDYFNIEANPSGVTLLASGPDRTNRHDLSRNDGGWIDLEGSRLGMCPFEDSSGGTWTMDFRIRPGLAGKSEWTAGTALRMNLYKCGDGLATPHYLSWRPIDVPRPDFHRPEYFGLVSLQG